MPGTQEQWGQLFLSSDWCAPQQASSRGFDGELPMPEGTPPDANGHASSVARRGSAERPDYSCFAQQKRSSVELGMGMISHAANINPGETAIGGHLCM